MKLMLLWTILSTSHLISLETKASTPCNRYIVTSGVKSQVERILSGYTIESVKMSFSSRNGWVVLCVAEVRYTDKKNTYTIEILVKVIMQPEKVRDRYIGLWYYLIVPSNT